MKLRRLGSLAAALVLVAPAADAWGSSGPSATQLNGARLAGRFLMMGWVTAAAGVRGERRGDRVRRTWTFSGPCAATPCSTATLVRDRAGGRDQLTLYRRSPSVYAGSGSFVLPVTCQGRRYSRGEVVPFSITVTVTEVRATALGPLAGRLQASYVSRYRQNLTPCVLAPAHDSARYSGALD